MKVRVAEASGPALDWMVAKCWYSDRRVELTEGKTGVRVLRDPTYDGSEHSHWFVFFGSTDWAQGGPLIERENIATSPLPNNSWRAYAPHETRVLHGQEIFNWQHKGTGPTPLIAAMRCYVVSKLGDEVEVPDELA